MGGILVDRFGKPVAFREGVAAARKIIVQVCLDGGSTPAIGVSCAKPTKTCSSKVLRLC